jgi:hypothetical protein
MLPFPHSSVVGFAGLACGCFLATVASAFTLRVDFDSPGTTQPGWQSLAAANSDLGDSWSRVYAGGIGVDADVIGGVTLDSRDRAAANGGGSEASMWRDFLFANGSFSAAPGTGLSIAITGLLPNTMYPVRIWAFDASSANGRRADWSGGGAGPVTLGFNNTPTPSTLNDDTVTLNVTTNGSGAVTLSGLVAAASPNASHNVFINGLEIGDPVMTNGPTDIALSGTIVARAATVGTTVGTFSSTDPTPGDTFTYSLVTGAGETDNGRFEIIGNTLRTDSLLTSFPGGTELSIRVRTTDALGSFFEKAFPITVVNDSDNDGLDDTWELQYFPDLTVATGSGNNDADSLINTVEQTRGTNPTLADTDGDSLSDDVENGSGTYVSPTNTGSNPLVVDTDGDGINDGDEVSPANGYITDPNKADTDGDGFSDSLEISAGTSPINGGDFPNTLLPLKLNEILASNNTGQSDGFGIREDWIEIFNPNNVVVNLDAYYLTDNATLLTKWNFPNVTIPAGGYLVVFASGKNTVDPGGKVHTNFQLGANGEYLAIVRPDGTTIDDAFSPAFPEQFTDVPYGRHPTTGDLVFFQTATPGAQNPSSSYPGVVKDTHFTIDRGFYDTPFATEVTTATPGATIRYTLDGTKPTTTNGTVYSGPIAITGTTTLRAIAYLAGWLPTNVDTHTYIFVDQVAQQPANPPGWPTTWGSHDGIAVINADSQMDPRVVNNTNGTGVYTMREALLDIPTVSLALLPSDFISDATGIYANPQDRVEKECSMEYILPDGTKGFQKDCKVEIQGNASRRPARMHKHSLRVTFTSTIGDPKLDYPLFTDTKVTKFNKLVLRACFTDSWGLVSWGAGRYRPNDSQYTRDVWMKKSMGAMGQPTSHGRFVHLYVNGLYFGLHDLTERLEDDTFAEHLGGKTEDWEVNADIGTPGPLWNSMIATVNGNIATPAVYEVAKTKIDLANYADYMLLHFYADAEDWPTKNAYAAANAVSGDGRYRFFAWDQEIALDKFTWNRYSANTGVAIPFQRLRLNADFRMLFADRVHKHLFNGGALSEEGSKARYLKVANEIDKAIVAESARWGDTQATTPYASTPGSSTNIDADDYPPTLNNPIYFTREQHWVVERDVILDHYIPILHSKTDSRGIINELRANNLYPALDAPEFFQHGGFVPRGYELHMTAPDLVYYTTNGEDPRLEGGATNPNALTYNPGTSTVNTTLVGATPASPTTLFSIVPTAVNPPLTWTAYDFDEVGWETNASGDLGVGYERNPPESYTPLIQRDVTSTMMDASGSVYLRYEFNLTGTPNFSALALAMKYDDGFVAYLNGTKIDEQLAPATPQWNSVSTGSHESGVTTFDRTTPVSPALLRSGLNVLAIHGLNQSSGSSDFLIVPELSGQRTVTSNADPVIIDGSRTVRARVLSGGTWSALTEAFFSTRDLVVSEFMYRPATVGNAEFIELMNIGTQTLDLSGVSFTAGVTFNFAGSAVTSLAPGGRVLVIQDPVAFESVYGAGLNGLIAGSYAGSLSNDGETIRLEGIGGVVLREFTYNDVLPWPKSADGGGRSLILINPASDPDHNVAANWRPSAADGGVPGTGDAIPFTGDPLADTNANGRADLLDYAFGSGTAILTPGAMGSSSFKFSRVLGADGAVIGIEVSPDMVTWTDLGTSPPLMERTVSGMEEILTYAISDSLGGDGKIFVRLYATLAP